MPFCSPCHTRGPHVSPLAWPTAALVAVFCWLLALASADAGGIFQTPGFFLIRGHHSPPPRIYRCGPGFDNLTHLFNLPQEVRNSVWVATIASSVPSVSAC